MGDRTNALPLAEALRVAAPFVIASDIVEQCLAEDVLFRRAWRDGLESLSPSERRGRLCYDLGKIAEAVGMLLLAEAGLDVFSEAGAFDGHGVDLLALTKADEVLAIEVKGTLRAGRLPRLGRSRLRQMSLEWLSSPTNPAMVDWELGGADVFGAVLWLDFDRREWRAALTGDFVSFAAVRELADLNSNSLTRRLPPAAVAEVG